LPPGLQVESVQAALPVAIVTAAPSTASRVAMRLNISFFSAFFVTDQDAGTRHRSLIPRLSAGIPRRRR
jgi:hypothetical protein